MDLKQTNQKQKKTRDFGLQTGKGHFLSLE